MERKNAAFQKLKPPCVALSQVTLSLGGPKGNNKAVTEQLESLKRVLDSVVLSSNNLDAKIAEYVFFPISQVLKFSQKASIRALELCLQCIAILIQQGWRQQISTQLVGQLVIFCSMLAEKNPKNLAFTEATDELQESALDCLYQLFSVLRKDSETAKLLRSEPNFPQLGQTISVTLESIYDGRSAEVQIVGTNTLRALLSSVMDIEMQASFLPGIVSKLTKILSPQTKTRRNNLVLTNCLAALESILHNIMSDARQASVIDRVDQGTPQDGREEFRSIIDEEWQEQAASQLKPALAKIVKLRGHSRDDVQAALGKLCLMILRSCRTTLSNCTHLALDTLVSIAAAERSTSTNVDLEVLVSTDSSISVLLQDILYESIRSIITVMQGSDEQAKSTKMQQISTAYELLMKAGTDTRTIDQMLATTLRDIVVVTLNLPTAKYQSAPLAKSFVSTDLMTIDDANDFNESSSPLVRLRGQEQVLNSVEQTARLISSSASGLSFASDLARHLRHSEGETQIANFWLLLTASKSLSQRKSDIDDLLNFGSESSTDFNEYIEEMYSLSLSILTDSLDHRPDARLQALALRALALRSQRSGRDFRYDLIDALYPVLHTLAIPDESLQHDSIVTLKVFTTACGYTSVRDLIVENVDYLTNAVALRLNAFDVSPQAPQVLLMMVRLAGSSLLPYLEDTIESIFAALEDYHGYPLLVELLFKVLAAIADEGVKNPQLAITNGDIQNADSVLTERWRPTTIAGLSSTLEESAKEDQEQSELASDAYESHPKIPWKELNENQGDAEEMVETKGQRNTGIDVSEPSPPAPKTYNLLLKIADLTQHFLPSASPSLRASLLSLIVTAVPAIAQHENSFLPLINTLWPEVVSRLDDDENFIIGNALAVVKVFCEYARGFMRTRIIQLWPRLDEIYKTILRGANQLESKITVEPIGSNKQDSLLLRRSSHASKDLVVASEASVPCNDTSRQYLQNSLIACLSAIVRFVPIAPEMVDDALTMLQPSLQEEDVRTTFSEENSDALWLMQLRTHSINIPDPPIARPSLQWQFAQAPS